MKRRSFNYLATINACHPRPLVSKENPLGMTKRALKKDARDRSPIHITENLVQYSDGSQYLYRGHSGGMVTLPKP